MPYEGAEQISDGLTALMSGFMALRQGIEEDFATTEDDDSDADFTLELEAAVITEFRAAIEDVLDMEDYSVPEVASMATTMVEALEEIDPDVFADADEE